MEPTRNVGTRWVAFIALANLGLYLGYFGPLEVLLPDQVQAIAGPAGKIAALGWVTGVGAAAALIANPVAGALSDRTTGRFGRRHPWTVGGALAGAAALVLLAGQHTIAGVIVAWSLAQVGLNAMQASIAAGVPDHVPVRQRGAVSGWIGIPQIIGVVLAVALVTLAVTGNGGYALIAVLVVACALPFALTTPDPPLARAARPPFAWREFLASFWLSPRRYPDFGWAWLTRFTISLGNAMAILYLLYFLRDRIHYSTAVPRAHGRAGPAHPGPDLLRRGHPDHGGGRDDLGPHRPAQAPGDGLGPGHGGPRGHARVLAVVAGRHRLGRDPGPGLRRVPVGGPGPGDPGAAFGGRPRQGSRRLEHRRVPARGAGPGDRRAAGQQVRRVPDPVPDGRRAGRAQLGAGLEDPLGPLS